MEITIIHGQNHKGSTYHITNRIKELLVDRLNEKNQKSTDAEITVHEYFMPKDTPEFCVGCFQCILKGEEYCPQADKVQKIVESMLSSEIIMIDSPTYCFEMTGQLKTLFDHLGFMWMSHRPRREMFSKIGIVISTSAGAGQKRVTKSIAKQLFWWGVPKIYPMPINVNAGSWNDVSEKVRRKIDNKVEEICSTVERQTGKAKYNVKTVLLFNVMRKMQQSNTWNMTDKAYWQNNNWLGSAKPWRL